jgi:hypothetical protein
MSEVGEEYTQEDLEITFNCEHSIIGCVLNNRVVGFCVLMKPLDVYYVSYTWCERTAAAKRVFIEGIKYLIKHYPDVKFIEEKEPIMYRAYLKLKGNKWQ